jgi:hypothetical protein
VAHRTVSGALGWSMVNRLLSGNGKCDVAIIHRTVWWCTGLSVEPTALGATVVRAINARHVACSNGRLGAPDCPVCTGQCPVCQPALRSNGRLRRYRRRSRTGHEQWLSGGAPACPVHHSTAGKKCRPN